jgi:hypothetical protein
MIEQIQSTVRKKMDIPGLLTIIGDGHVTDIVNHHWKSEINLEITRY